ncbi:uroporphyrinogen decarboxylase family protein [Sporohalobacter salinus]|uniref:uroporphyrinogen decarboxylase family protein n=1 Tax=Sporohalobacter salinus TaxID=1494606 RepID=UPI001962094C|nr:uroporphyrinogen decarboxylase family protein [Sporohalobacter salinus]MBM7625040.1 [methyl-Co(III) methanol-specific corrinoid protein]:coenzyme M methyltransferase [Sporohalobacter salinus]
MNSKQRLLKVLKGEQVDRPPVICPGGMMNAGVTELLTDIEENHNVDPDAMVEVAEKICDLTGFENYGVPFCMTVECEPLGIELDMGSKTVEPRVTEYNQGKIEEIMENYEVDPKQDKRMPVVLDAISRLKNDEVPVIGNITGHVSTATSIIDPLMGIKMIRKQPERIYDFFEYINNYLIEYAEEMIKAGADIIAVSDPTATGEILGSDNFEKFAVPFYRDLVKAVHDLDVPVIIHICGDAKTILDSLNLIGADAFSFDSRVNMKFANSKLETGLMGNINTQLLHTGEKNKIISITNNAINSGVDIVSPACGLSMATPIDNLKAMTDFVKRGNS